MVLLYDQEPFINEVKGFIDGWGLKIKFVARQCGISEQTFYKWLAKRSAFSENQLQRVQEYVSNYIQRNAN